MGGEGDERSGLGHLSCGLRDGWTDYLTKAFSEVIADLKTCPHFHSQNPLEIFLLMNYAAEDGSS